VARVAKLCEKSGFEFSDTKSDFAILYPMIHESIQAYNLSLALELLWKEISELDKYIEQTKPWELLKNNSADAQKTLRHAVDTIRKIATLLQPFLPRPAVSILEQFQGPKISSQPPLYPRLME
jgi:methionyl-tRNA synthetase